MTTASRFGELVVARQLRMTLAAFVVSLVVFSSRLSASARLLPESFTRECQGTADGLQNRFASRPLERFQFYRDMYENCTKVTSNLEIVHLNPGSESDFDLSFFENIREVHGYVLAAANQVDRLPLTSLRVIRGIVLFDLSSTPEEDRLSLCVAGNEFRVIELPALREILRGNVLYKNNRRLCYGNEDTIDWSYILPQEERVVRVGTNISDCATGHLCDETCRFNLDTSRRLCWGPGPHLCQKKPETTEGAAAFTCSAFVLFHSALVAYLSAKMMAI